jgi:quercetin dioxygenase-like cupin family protein
LIHDPIRRKDLNGKTSAALTGLRTLFVGLDPYAKRTLSPQPPISQRERGSKKKRNSLVAAPQGCAVVSVVSVVKILMLNMTNTRLKISHGRYLLSVSLIVLCGLTATAQTAAEKCRPAGVIPVASEPPAKITVDPPLAGPLDSRGVVIIPYCAENLHLVPVFGPGALSVSPRVGHLHVSVDGAPWRWADASGNPIIIMGLAPGPHKVLLELEDANHRTLDHGEVNFVVPATKGAEPSSSPGTKRTNLQRHDLSAPGREMVQVRVDFDPGYVAPRHTHFGEEIIYVIEGTLEYKIGDNPPVTVKTGDVLFVPAGTIHSVKNVGSGNGAELATYIVEKGKPLLTEVK